MKIAFTFDPFEENKWNRNQLSSLVAVLSNEKDKLTAYYIAGRAESQLATAYDVPEKERFSVYPKKLMEKELSSLKLSHIEAKVLTESSLSQSTAVSKLSSTLKKDKVDLAVVPTNAKSILPRIIFGSFAETLVHVAQTDLLVYHQKTKVGSKAPSSIVFAHDLTAKGDRGLERALTYAKKWNAKLIVVHVGLPDDEKKMNTKIKKIEKSLESAGVEFEVDTELSWDDTPSLIMDYATKKRAAFIALAAGSDDDAPLLGGNVVRQILRESKIPTMVLKV